MTKSKKDIGLIAFITLLLILLCLIFCGIVFSESKNPSSIKFEIYNPYIIGVDAVVKCGDWIEKDGKFQLEFKQKFKGQEKTVLYIPKYIQKCQIWIK